MRLDVDPADIEAVQLYYPVIWIACHREHRKRDASGISDHEAGLLTHLAGIEHCTPAQLAKHLGVGASAVSAQLQRLRGLGLLDVQIGIDKRRRTLSITEAGRKLSLQRSPLDTGLVSALLGRLKPEDRAIAVRGLQLLASAAHS
jgi:DNA-binding MarR family transcriptional regulator